MYPWVLFTAQLFSSAEYLDSLRLLLSSTAKWRVSIDTLTVLQQHYLPLPEEVLIHFNSGSRNNLQQLLILLSIIILILSSTKLRKKVTHRCQYYTHFRLMGQSFMKCPILPQVLQHLSFGANSPSVSTSGSKKYSCRRNHIFKMKIQSLGNQDRYKTIKTAVGVTEKNKLGVCNWIPKDLTN